MNIFENFKNFGKIKNDNFEFEHLSLQNDDFNQENVDEKIKLNTKLYFVVSCLIFIVFTIQLFKLQVVRGYQHQLLAEGNRIRTEEIKAPRGIIFDVKEYPLVKNIPLYDLVIYPANLPREKSERYKVYEKMKEIINDGTNVPIEEIENEKLLSPEPYVVKSMMEKKQAMYYEMSFYDTPGIKVNVVSARQYDKEAGLGHILGYIGKISQEELSQDKSYSMTDYIGQNGVESSYENFLKGTKGQWRLEVDSAGKIQRELGNKDPIPGNNLITSINYEVQKKAYKVIEEKINIFKKDKKDVKHAVVVAIDPRDGGIIAMASYPTYDNNLFSLGLSNDDYQKLLNDSEKPMLNRAISGVYPSGSVIKPVVAIAGLDVGVVNDKTTINDPGEIKIGDYSFPDWKNHGLVDVKKAIAESCNIFFYAIGGGWDKIDGIGVEQIDKYLDKFGFGKKTNVEIMGEEKGNIPTPAWKEEVKGEPWYLGDTYHLAIGQGDFLVTPIQVANSIAAIANGGTLYKPHFVKKVVDNQGQTIKEFTPVKLNENLADKDNIEIVRQGMKLAVDSGSGSARQLKELPVSSGGKTGTAQFDATDMKKTHSWFVGFAPYDNPEIAIAVIAENGGDGFDVAEPIALEVLKEYFKSK